MVALVWSFSMEGLGGRSIKFAGNQSIGQLLMYFNGDDGYPYNESLKLK